MISKLYDRYTNLKPVKLVKNLAFLVAILTELMCIIIDKSVFVNPIEGTIWRITFVLCCITVICTRYTLKEILFFLLFCVLGLLSYKSTGRNEMLRLIVLMMAGKDMFYETYLKIVFYVLTAGSALIALLSVCGVLGSVSVYADYGRRGYETRYCFGMGHPNSFHCMVFTLMILGIVLWFQKLKWWHYVIFFGLQGIVYLFTDSRCGMLCAMFALVVSVLFTYCRKWRDQSWVYILCALLVVAVFAFSVYAAAVKSETALTHYFDFHTNRRIHGAVEQVDAGLNSWTLFGRPAYVEFFDMGIIRLFYWFGYVPGVLYMGAMLWLLYRAYKEKEYGLAIMTVSFTLYSLVEAHFISDYLLRNYLWIYMMGAMWRQFSERKRGALCEKSK